MTLESLTEKEAEDQQTSEDIEEEGDEKVVRRRWFKYAGIKPERTRRAKLDALDEPIEVASLSNLEAEAMNILWDLGRPASAMEVLEYSLYQRRERGEEPVSFPALQSTLRRLSEKGLLDSRRDSYRTIRYVTSIDREVMAVRILNNVALRLVGKSLPTLLPLLTGSSRSVKLSPAEKESIDKLKKALEDTAATDEE